jgi:denticleless
VSTLSCAKPRIPSILRYWDLRQPTRKSRSTKPHTPSALYTTATDPTALDHSLRPRGITSLALGTGPTAGLIFALGADSRIHTYTAPTLEPLTKKVYAHKNMQTNSFYVKLAVSPCGRWLASGCGGNDGSAFLFDVSGAASPGVADGAGGVELRGQQKEVGSVDWAEGELATCADDGTVRVWRPNVEVYRQCLEDEAAFRDWSWQFVDKHA